MIFIILAGLLIIDLGIFYWGVIQSLDITLNDEDDDEELTIY